MVPEVYVQAATAATARAELTSGDRAQYGRRVLTMAANQGKGWFAILLGKAIDHKTILPAYIRNAIFFARPNLSVELFFNIYSYRINCAQACGDVPQAVADYSRATLKQYREGGIDLAALKNMMVSWLPGDQIHEVLANVE